ncbi:hypothetical protein WDU94_011568 [Cyamophila willieti]
MAPYASEFQPERHPSLSLSTLSSGASYSSSFESDFDPNVILHLTPLPEGQSRPFEQSIPSILVSWILYFLLSITLLGGRNL